MEFRLRIYLQAREQHNFVFHLTGVCSPDTFGRTPETLPHAESSGQERGSR